MLNDQNLNAPKGNPGYKYAYKESGYPEHSSLPKEEYQSSFCQYHQGGLYIDPLQEYIKATKRYMQQHQNKHMIATTVNRKYRTIIILGEVNRIKLQILLDLGATRNHLYPEVARKVHIE